MTAGRVLASVTAAVAVAGCVALVVGMSDRSDPAPAADSYRPPLSTSAVAPAVPAAPLTSSTPAPPSTAAHSTAVHSSAATRTVPAATTSAGRPPATSPAVRSAAAPRSATPAAKTKSAASSTPAAAVTQKKGIALPLKYRTGNATRVITVRAVNRSRTTAHLQAWYKSSAGGWLKYGKGVTAHIGAQGMTPTPSEGASATPMGSFTLTQAFGHNADPGTPLPYLHTTPSDWWISQAGPLYNTHQRCSSHCAFRRSMPPNEHLYYETPYYNYAVVIDYNTRNAPGGVRQGAGSAFFLHVTDGAPTAGCVAIPQARLVTLMKWLRPRTHPRILIGTL